GRDGDGAGRTFGARRTLPPLPTNPMKRATQRFALVSLVAAAACSPDQPAPLSPFRGEASVAAAADKTPGSVSLVKIGGFANGGVGASEIPAFDHVSKRIFVVNGLLGSVDVYDAKDPSNPVFVERLAFSGSANSVAADRGVIAVAVQAADKVSKGTVELFRAT